MKNTLPMRLRVFELGYRIMLCKLVRWAGGVLAGAILSAAFVMLSPIMVLACAGGSVWVLYMSVFDQAGLKRLAERNQRRGDTNDELRD